MLKRSALPALLVAIIATGVVAEFLPASPAGAGAGSTGASDAVANVAARRSLTARAVSAARAFEASLSAAQRAAVRFSFASPKRIGWSILPTNLKARNGVAIKDLGARQRARLRALLRTILSARGYSDEVAIRRVEEDRAVYERHLFSSRLHGHAREVIGFRWTPDEDVVVRADRALMRGPLFPQLSFGLERFPEDLRADRAGPAFRRDLVPKTGRIGLGPHFHPRALVELLRVRLQESDRQCAPTAAHVDHCLDA